MFKKAFMALAILLMATAATSCKDKEPAVVPTAPPPPAPVPVAEPAPEPVDTETESETEPAPVEEPASGKTGGGISKSSLIGNYKCSIATKDLPLGMTPPAATCKIYEGSGGELKIGPVGGTGINGNVAINGNKLKVTGNFNLGIGILKINAAPGRQNAKLYKGKGTGSFGDLGSISYTLTLKKL